MNLKLINIISVIIPATILLLLQIDLPGNFSYFPHIYAPINGLVFILLIFGLIAIRYKNVSLHKTLIRIAILLSIVFLVMYIMYHGTSTETKFPGKGILLYFYYFILSTHILLSVVAIPLVLRTYYYGSINEISKHKKIAKYAFGLWLYVAATGVMVYIIISPYYN